MGECSDNSKVVIEITRDEALVLAEFSWRFERKDILAFANYAEFAAFSRLLAPLDYLWERGSQDWWQILKAARKRVGGDEEVTDIQGRKLTNAISEI